jgi:hypothetical protein
VKLIKCEKRYIYGIDTPDFETIRMPIIYKKNIKFLFFRHTKRVRFIKNKNKKDLRIAFQITGAFGDILIKTNYLYHLYKYLEPELNKDIVIDVFTPKFCEPYIRAVMQENTYINNIHVVEDFKNNKGYDLFMHSVGGLVNFYYWNPEKIKKFCPLLYEWIIQYKTFKEKFNYWGPDNGSAYTYAIAKANNKHKLQIGDINSTLKIKKEFDFPLPYTDNEDKILEKFNLQNTNFITINRQISRLDPTTEGTKMWSLNNMNELIRKIKEKYPNMTLVQLGYSKENSKTLGGIDVNLIGKTTIEDIKVLIKNSFLHVDCEGGFAHLRNALKAKHPAIVIFGPTDPNIYAYKSNINIYKNICPIHCEWTSNRWQINCANTKNERICTNSITPTEVFEVIDNYIQKENIYDGK